MVSWRENVKEERVSIFEKLLISIIIFVFCVIILIQIFINNDVLDTIKANEQGTPVSYEDSINALVHGDVTIQSSNINNTIILLNGETIESDRGKYNNPMVIQVLDGDVIEIKNIHDEEVKINIIKMSDEIDAAGVTNSFDCRKGITYLFKVKMKKNID